MKILLTNDDGIDAPGLQALWDSVHHAFAGQEIEVTVVAPDRGRSECGHSVTTSRALRAVEVKSGWHSVDGTPVDCVRVALGAISKDADFVFSGINAGANLGVNLMVSGTFAAAREAALIGVPSMAISHYRRPDVPKTWEHTPAWLAETIPAFVQRAASSKKALLWNANLPAIDPASPAPKQQWCEVDGSPIIRTAIEDDDGFRFDYDFHGRPRKSGTDVDLCFSGSLTISEMTPEP